MKRKIFSALLSLAAIAGVAVASLPLTRPTIIVNPREMVVVQSLPFVVTASFTNANEFCVFVNSPTIGDRYDIAIPEDMKNCSEMHSIQCTFVTESTVLLWFYVYAIDEDIQSYDVAFCRVESSDI